MRSALFCLALAATAAACQSSPTRTEIAPTDIQSSLGACMTDRVDVGLLRLDSLLEVSPGHGDVLATRGLCRSVRFAADSVQADARAAFADLTAALDAITAEPGAFQTPAHQLYNQRAFVVQALRPGDWPASLADFERAVALDQRNAAYVLDLGVARAMAGDTAAARANLRQFLALAPSETARAEALRSLLGGPPADPARPPR